MKQVRVSCLLTIAFSVILTASFAAAPKIYAVVVGIAKYKDAAIPNLKYSEKDAQAFHDFLRSVYAGAVPEENISLLLGANATRSNIIREVVDIFDRSTSGDMIIFYFSGHGKGKPSDKEGYLLSYDTENDNEDATALSMDELENKIHKKQAKLKVSYIDACHAGYYKGGDGVKGTTEENNALIIEAMNESIARADNGNVAFLSSSPQQQSIEDDKLGNGVFTYYLLKGLRGEADMEEKNADGYNNGVVTVGEMSTYLSDKIPAATKHKQKPTVRGIEDENFPLSVLRSNVMIGSEMAKRPEKKIKPKTVSPVVMEKPADEKLSAGKTYDGHMCYGLVTFINNSKSVLNLYKISTSSWAPTDVNIQIIAGKMAITPRMNISETDNRNDCNDKFRDYGFYFSIIENEVQKYAVYKTTIESGKNQYVIVDDGTLSFSENKPW